MEDLKQTAETVGHDIAAPLEFAAKACKVLDSVLEARPELKQVLGDLITKSEALGTDASLAVVDRGASITLDMKTAADLLAYVAWVRSSLVPAVLAVYGDLKADVA